MIDPNAAHVIPRALQLLEVMTEELCDIPQHNRGLQTIQRLFRLPAKCFELRDTFAASKARNSAIAIAADYAVIYLDLRITSIVIWSRPVLA